MILQAVGLLLFSLTLYRLCFSLLARLPGPTICALTRLPLMYHEFRGHRRTFIHQLHLRYGSVVRVAPDEVSFATREAVKEIYTSGGSGYDKSSFYRLFENFDRPNMFSTLEKGKVSISCSAPSAPCPKKLLTTYILKPDVAAVVQDHADTFIIHVADNVGKSIDIYDLLHRFALDAITGHVFYPAGLHSLTDPRDHEIVKEMSYTNGLTNAYCQHYFPLLHRIYIKLKGVKKLRRSDNLIGPYILNTTREGVVAPHTILQKLRSVAAETPILHRDDEPVLPVPNWDWKSAASECMDHVAAGIDTTGDALCFLLHHLSLPTPASQRVQGRLCAELSQHPAASTGTDGIDALPYLDAVVKEGLRVFTPIPMSLPRVVPAGGRAIGGLSIPAGTIVSCQAYTLHRLDASVFPDPEEFMPERWLETETEKEGVVDRNGLFFAFAAGGRGCIGKHLALLEMKLLLCGVYSAYRTSVAPDMNASMEQDDQTISSRPKGQRCLIVFHAI